MRVQRWRVKGGGTPSCSWLRATAAGRGAAGRARRGAEGRERQADTARPRMKQRGVRWWRSACSIEPPKRQCCGARHEPWCLRQSCPCCGAAGTRSSCSHTSRRQPLKINENSVVFNTVRVQCVAPLPVAAAVAVEAKPHLQQRSAQQNSCFICGGRIHLVVEVDVVVGAGSVGAQGAVVQALVADAVTCDV